MKLFLRVAIVLGLTVFLLWLWLRSIDGPATWRALEEASGLWLALAALMGLVHVPARALRWRALLDVGGAPPPFRELSLSIAIGYLVTYLVPGRIGELVRPGLLSHRCGLPLGVSLASVVFERILDVATLLLLLGTYVLLTPGVPETLARGVAVAGLVAAGALAVGIMVHHRFRSPLDMLVSRTCRRLPGRLGPRLERLGLTALRGFDSLLRPGAWWRLPLLSLLTWSTPALVFAWSLRAAGAHAGPTAPLLLVGFGAAGIALPTPAGIGGFQALTTHALVDLLAVPEAQAAATAVIAHAASVVPIALLGLYYCWRESLSVGMLRRAAASTVSGTAGSGVAGGAEDPGAEEAGGPPRAGELGEAAAATGEPGAPRESPGSEERAR